MPVQVPRVEERDELFWRVAPIHVEGEQTAVLAVDDDSKDLQLSPGVVPCRAVASYEFQRFGQETFDDESK